MSTNPHLDLSGLSAEELDQGMLMSRLIENPGLSYSDRLGMQYFFTINK